MNEPFLTTEENLLLECNYNQKEFKLAFAKSLKKIRQYTQLSLLELERMTDINNSTLSRYENAKVEPSLWHAYVIVDFFHMTIEDFISYGLNSKPEDTDSIDITERFNENIAYFISVNPNAENDIKGIFYHLNIDKILQGQWS